MDWIARANTALVIVDVQKDFCPGGKLAVQGGDDIVPIVNKLAAHFALRIYTQDFHPADHKSFASNHAGKAPFETVDMPYGTQMLWPDHCVQGTDGAAFHADLRIGRIFGRAAHILQKGTHPEVDSYSGFFENDRVSKPQLNNGRTLTEFLRGQGVQRIVLCGLAYDFCVGWHALDAVKEKFNVVVVRDATRAIAMPAENGMNTEEAMTARLKAAGVGLVHSTQLHAALGATALMPYTPYPV